MPSFNPSMYSNYPIQIPPEFPKILKSYTKAAIRTQPYDLLLWSVSYFRCLANGEVPPVKERIEYPIQDIGDAAITPGLLKVLHKQVGKDSTTVSKTVLMKKWRGICLPIRFMENLINKGNYNDTEILWEAFLVDAAAEISKSVEETMEILCSILTDHPDGASNYMLEDSTFLSLLTRVGRRFEMDNTDLNELKNYLTKIGNSQGNILCIENLKSRDCPTYR